MNTFKKYTILLVFLLCLTINYVQLLASTQSSSVNQELIIDAGQEQGGAYYASGPECSNGLTEIIIFAGTVIVAGKGFIYPGIKGLLGTPSPVKQAVSIGQISIGLTMLAGVTLGMSTAVQCFFSFVRDPVVYENDDAASKMLDVNGNKVSNRWEAENAPRSENLTVCARPMLIPYVNMIFLSGVSGLGDLLTGFTNPGSTKNSGSCYGKTNEYGEDNDVYDGKDAFLCPEEWRFHKYRSEIRESDDSGTKVLKKHAVWVGNESDPNDKEAKTYRDILNMRQNLGPLQCEIGKVGDTINMHGFSYQIIRKGPKVCAQLQSFGLIPSPSGIFTVGCQYGKSPPPSPMCKNSEPIYLQSQKVGGANNTNDVVDSNGNKIIIDWDNSKCFSCIVDQVCYSRGVLSAKSAVPLSSYIMECLQSTLDNVVFGCVKGVNNERDGGMFYDANEQLKKISYLLIILAVIFFGFKILMTNSLPKLGEMVIMAIKIGVVLFFVHGKNEDTGMHWFYNQVTQISGSLSSILFRATNFNNNICTFTEDMYQNKINNPGFKGFLLPFDILDCKIFFYLGGALFGSDYKEADIGKFIVNAIPRLLLIIFPLAGLFDPLALILSIFLFIFAILILSLAIWLTSLIFLSTIMLFFLVLISPILVPMILFNYTKGFFDAWIKEIISYSLFPAFLFLFFGMILSIFDIKIFGATKFEERKIDILNREAYYYFFEDISGKCKEDGSSDGEFKDRCQSCKKWLNDDMKNCDGCDPASLVCKMRVFDVKKSTTIYGQGNIAPDQNNRFFVYFLESIGYLILMAIIFVTSLNTVTFLIAKVVGGSRSLYELINHGKSPMTMFLKIGKFASKPAVYLTKGFGKGVANKAKEAKAKKQSPAKSSSSFES